MVKQITSDKNPVNLKEKNAVHTFAVTIRNREQFYKIVSWLNENVGKGSDNWTMEGRVLRSLKQGKSTSRKIYIFKHDFDVSAALYLNLL